MKYETLVTTTVTMGNGMQVRLTSHSVSEGGDNPRYAERELELHLAMAKTDHEVLWQDMGADPFKSVVRRLPSYPTADGNPDRK